MHRLLKCVVYTRLSGVSTSITSSLGDGTRALANIVAFLLVCAVLSPARHDVCSSSTNGNNRNSFITSMTWHGRTFKPQNTAWCTLSTSACTAVGTACIVVLSREREVMEMEILYVLDTPTRTKKGPQCTVFSNVLCTQIRSICLNKRLARR
jgi:hypothetical protein